MMGGEEYGKGKKGPMMHIKPGSGSVIQFNSIQFYLYNTFNPGYGTGSVVFIDDVTADRSSRINCEVYRAMLFV